jgi:uncharacterized protein (DUF885 family)
MRPILLATALSLALLSGCDKPAAPTDHATASVPATAASKSAADWQKTVDTFLQGYFERNPTDAANAGKHEFDGKLPDWSKEGLKSYGDWLHAQRDGIAGIDAALNEQQKFQREYVLAVIDKALFWLEDARFPFRNPAFYADAISPSLYLTREYAPLPQRMAAFVTYEENLPAAVAQIRANLEAPLPATYITYGTGLFGGLATYFKNDVPKAFAEVKDDALQARFKTANEKAVAAMGDLSAWLKSQQPNATQDFALGAARYTKMLHDTERVDMPLDQLKAAGEADLARNLASLKSACDTYLPGKPLSACVDKVEADKPQGGAVEGARAQLVGLRQFIIDKDLVSIPGTEQAKVDEAPPFNRSNFAYIEIPGPYEKGLPSIYYIAPPDPTWPKAEQAAYVPGKNVLLFTSAHEVYPGHFVQFLHANRSDWLFGRLFVGYAYAEGWAHYCEEMMYDAGLGDSKPEAHIGQLTEALLRNVRFLSSIGLHTGGMSVADSEKMFREQAFQDAGNARQQAGRGTYDPAYLNYTLGKLMIKQLREDWTKSRGGRAGWKAFHDQFLSYGGPPIPLVRAQMLGGKPETVLWHEAASASDSSVK